MAMALGQAYVQVTMTLLLPGTPIMDCITNGVGLLINISLYYQQLLCT